MNQARNGRRTRARREARPGAMNAWIRRVWARTAIPLVRRFLSLRRRGVARSQEPAKWRRHPGMVEILSWLGSALLLLWAGWAVSVLIHGRPWSIFFNPDQRCSNVAVTCAAFAGFIIPVLSLALAFAAFLTWRYWRIRGLYNARARKRAQALVPTAGRIIGNVVGRDPLCSAIMEDQHRRDGRMPYVIVGGVGAGKTAVLVRLTELLSRHAAVPVPVRLRDARKSLDFAQLAYKKFCAETDLALLSEAEGDKVWRQLRKDDKIVVLADGLEEALADAQAERDNLIRNAIRDAHEQRLPLVIASRPHDPLRGMRAAIIELEPLSEEAALNYVEQGAPDRGDPRLDWIVEKAGVTDAPLYLQITRELGLRGLLKHIPSGVSGRSVDTRGVDRSELRRRLLDTYVNAIISGNLHEQLPISAKNREATVNYLSALACVGLRQDTLEVRFADLTGEDDDKPGSNGSDSRAGPRHDRQQAQQPYPELRKKLDSSIGVLLAATWGTQLDLAESLGDRVRFPHSVMEAYLGSRLMGSALQNESYRKDALENPGREFLIALLLHSRQLAHQTDEPAVREGRAGNALTTDELRDLVFSAASSRPVGDAKFLDLYAAALEIDTVAKSSRQADIAKELAGRWQDLENGGGWRDTGTGDRTIQEAKFELARRFGDALREVTERERRTKGNAARPALQLARRFGGAVRDVAKFDLTGKTRENPVRSAYAEFYEIACCEPSYPVRLAIAQEIGAGGDAAFTALADTLAPPNSPGEWPVLQGVAVKEGEGHTLERARPVPSANLSGRAGKAAENQDSEQLRREEHAWRHGAMQAWLAPLLVGSVTTGSHKETSRQHLEEWLGLVGRAARWRQDSLPITCEIALAQGFKYAANRRSRHPHAQDDSRDYLSEQAREMLKNADYWFSRLTLLHALCLWALPDGLGADGRDVQPEARVAEWLSVPDGEKHHPFVVQAGKLVVKALASGHPERFMWIDESGVVEKVGSSVPRPEASRAHRLWIPPSTGWSALDPDAQRLVADVLLLLNLSERGRKPSDRERRLQRGNRHDLPPCLAKNRKPLDPNRAVGSARSSEPGTNCAASCPFKLCPYPPKGEHAYRSELSAAFCRRQRALVGWTAGSGSWQGVWWADLKRFWKDMGDRARL